MLLYAALLLLGFGLRHLWLWSRRPAPLDPNSRRYARAMYHNGLISMEELDEFYRTHPEDETDDGKRG